MASSSDEKSISRRENVDAIEWGFVGPISSSSLTGFELTETSSHLDPSVCVDPRLRAG